MKAEEVLAMMADRLLEYLEELKDAMGEDDYGFLYGEKVAYTECLEMIQQRYDGAKSIGLDFDIEKKYPL